MERAAGEAAEAMREAAPDASAQDIHAAVTARLERGSLGMSCQIVDALNEATDPDVIYIVRGEGSKGSVVLCRVEKRDYRIAEVHPDGTVETRLVVSFS